MTTLLAFLFVLGVLVFVHELGHFIMARWHGVRVLVFSLGFGPRLLTIRRGDTEYCISAIPLGGYVKMAGEELDSESSAPLKPDEFQAKTKWQRFQVYVAGPVMNVILALVVMTFVLYNGATEPLYLERPAVVGSVRAGSVGERVGLKPGDVIVSVAGRPVPTWEKMELVVLPRAGKELDVVVKRDGVDQTLKITPDAVTKFEAGDLGIVPELHPQVVAVTPGDPAEKAGVRVGDAILAVNGQPRVTRQEAIARIQASLGKPVTLTVRRDGKPQDIVATPIKKGDAGWIGLTMLELEVREINPTFTQAIGLSVQQNLEWSTLIFQTVGQLLSGEASPKQLMGPIGIAGISGEAARLGARALFGLMAMISLNLAIINLLPIPVLDGGHIFIMALEGVARRNFSAQIKEKLLVAGLVVIMALMVTVIYNDLTRVAWIERLMPWR